MLCVCFCFRVFYNFRGEKRRSLYCSSSSHQKFVSADDKSKHNKPSPITITNLLTLALYMSHSSSSFGYSCIAVTAIHAVCVLEGVLQVSVERSGTTDVSRRPKIFVKAAI